MVIRGNYFLINDHIAFHPGYYLSEIVEFGDIAKEKISETSGIPLPELEKIMAGEEDINEHTARGIARAMGSSVDFWLNLQKSFDEEVKKHHGKERHSDK